MKKTLLQLTQDILDALDGEEINSIGDTVESRQIVTFIRNSYETIIDSLDLPITYTLTQLDGATSSALPIIMTRPDTIDKINWIKYDCQASQDLGQPNFRYITYLPIDEFFDRMYNITINATNIRLANLTILGKIFKIYYRTDIAPTYYTEFDGKTIVFDSFDAGIDSTLHAAKTLCYGQQSTVFTEVDSFIPLLDANQFVLLENEAKSQAFAEQKQTQDPVAERRARKAWIRSQRSKFAVPNMLNYQLNSTTNYGRHRGRIPSTRLSSNW